VSGAPSTERQGDVTGAPPGALCFTPFSLDPANEQLWRGKQEVPLKPKTFSVLRYLAERPQRLISKQELLDALWGEVHVGDAVLKTHLREIRVALHDDVRSPRFIETAHRRGYRFIASVQIAAQAAAYERAPQQVSSSSRFVGREAEFVRLEAGFEQALAGQLQTVFVSGEPGMGKTTLANAFLEALARRSGVWWARGQCIQQYGAGEAYLPVLEAFGRLARGDARGRVVEVLRRHAPSWLFQLPSLVDPAELAALARSASVTPERMLREMAEAMLALSEQQPLVCCFEDLHWADPSTLNLISYLARRSDPARVLIIGTYRPREVLEKGHPLDAIQQDLHTSGRCDELRLTNLSDAAVARLLAARFGADTGSPQLVRLVQERTRGHPLFVVKLLDSWVELGWMTQRENGWELTTDLRQLERSVPRSVARMIQREIAGLSERERGVLEAASVVGVEFSPLQVAAALEEGVAHVEEVCAAWARREHFVSLAGKSEWPDGSVSLRFAFNHGLYQQVAYDGIAPGRARELHARVGLRLELGFAEQAGSVAAVLAVHFERGGQYRKAVHYRLLASRQALSRSAHPEALDNANQALSLCGHLPQGAERMRWELELQVYRGAANAMSDYCIPEAHSAYAKARELCVQLGDGADLLPPVLEGDWKFCVARGDFRSAGKLAEEALVLGARNPESTLYREALLLLGASHFFLGRFPKSRELLERVLPLLDADGANRRPLFGEDKRVFVRSQLSWTLWMLGCADQALARANQAQALARELEHPFSLAFAAYFRGTLCMFRREYVNVLAAVDALESVADEHGFAFFRSMGCMLRGSALAFQGEVALGLATFQRAWSLSADPIGIATFFAFLWAQTLARAGRPGEAMQVLQNSIDVARRNADGWEPELHRLLGELALGATEAASASVAEQHLITSLELARGQQAIMLQLRSAVSLARLWQTQGKLREARELVSEVLGSCSEGWGTPDLLDAQALLDELAAPSRS
jgi:DNA-binding winged helix-turn-helix (wHTH) protein/tetratricopeptide (TPR) repeat protein